MMITLITVLSGLYLIMTVRFRRNRGEETEPICMDDCAVHDCPCKKVK